MKKTKKVVVLGGGSAGWVTALYIQRYWSDLDITVVEDPNRPPIIAGESGNTLFTDFLSRINISTEDFIKASNALPKLGGKFIDWNGEGTEFLHCMQTDHSPWLEHWSSFLELQHDNNLNLSNITRFISNERIRSDYLKAVVANDVPLEYMFHSGEFMRQDKVPFGAPVVLPCRPMWHFESRATALWFRKIGIERNISVILGEYIDSTSSTDGGISEIILADGRRIEADWFFDCSGFSRLLIQKHLKVEQSDLSHIFPARSVVAWWDESVPNLTTNAYAMKYGWSWNINLRHRSGNGYIFDPDLTTLSQAVEEASARFNKKIEPVANFTYTPGVLKESWKKNVIAVGLSSGFLEPLEANGVAVIIEAMYSLSDYWDPYKIQDNESLRIQKFNNKMFQTYDDIKDFLALHYRGQRNDTKFWQSHKDPSRVPDSLKDKLSQWEEFYNGDKPEPYFLGYSPAAWLFVLQGLQIFKTDALKSKFYKINKKEEIMHKSVSFYKEYVDPFWTLKRWLQEMDK
jgi:tryptophan halogenase